MNTAEYTQKDYSMNVRDLNNSKLIKPQTILKYSVFENLPNDILDIIYDEHIENKRNFLKKYFKISISHYTPIRDLFYYHNRFNNYGENKTHESNYMIRPTILLENCDIHITKFQKARIKHKVNYKRLIRQLRSPNDYYIINRIDTGWVTYKQRKIRDLIFKHTIYNPQ